MFFSEHEIHNNIEHCEHNNLTLYLLITIILMNLYDVSKEHELNICRRSRPATPNVMQTYVLQHIIPLN